MNGPCAQCRAPLTPGEAFCGECGAATTAPMRGAPSTSPSPPETQRRGRSSGATPGSSGTIVVGANRVLYVVPESLLVEADASAWFREVSPTVTSGDLVVVRSHDALAEVQRRLASLGVDSASPRVDAVCLLGTHASLPHAAVANAVGDEDVLTDNYYGRVDEPNEEARNSGDLLPLVPVSRLPFDDIRVLEAVFARPSSLHGSWADGALVSCDVWQGASAAVVEHLGAAGPLHLSPPTALRHMKERMEQRPGRLYFNVHGSGDEAVWVGQSADGQYPEVLRPAAVQVADGAVVVSEACYGGACFDDEQAMGQAFLARGANAFYGSTIIAWGPPTAPPGLADLIPIHVYAELDVGRCAGEALLEAKREIRRAYLERDGLLTAQAHNTLLSFCHFGLPLCRASSPASSKRRAPPLPGSSLVNKTSSSMVGALRSGSSPGGVLQRVRGQLADKSREQGWGVDAFVQGPLEQIAQTLGPLAHLLDRVRSELGSSARGGVLLKYRTKVGERLTLVVHETGRKGAARGLIADGAGQVLEEFVTRSGA